MNRFDLPPAEVARWQKVAGEPLWEAWVKKMEAQGPQGGPRNPQRHARDVEEVTRRVFAPLAGRGPRRSA